MKRVFIISIPLLMTSCAVLTSKSTKTMNINHTGVIQTPVMVDIDVKSNKVNGIATGRNSIEILKQEAIADAIEKSGADVLVEPSFKTETTFKSTIVNVSGYPGYYKNFRNIQPEDLKTIDNNTKTAQVEKNNTLKKKRSKGAIIGVVVGTVLLSILLLIN